MSTTDETGPAERPGAHQDEGSVARRGFVLITGAKLWFLLCSAGLNLALPRLLEVPARYGEFAVINTFASILNMVMVTGALQAVAKRGLGSLRCPSLATELQLVVRLLSVPPARRAHAPMPM